MNQTALDPDRYLNFSSPGAQEWWYFDAISDDGRHGLVIVWYAGLPFDPRYGKAALRHLHAPDRHAAPHPLDHCAFGLSWYDRQGRSISRLGPGNPGPFAQAYALNSYSRDRFEHRGDPLSIRVDANRFERDDEGYRLTIDTPDVGRRHRIVADLRFDPTVGIGSFERDLGSPNSPHLWMLAAPDCRVRGTLTIEGPGGSALSFQGRGYHDHNAGAEELSHAMRFWEWGRVHHGDETEIYYIARPRRGEPQALWITARQGEVVAVRDAPELTPRQATRNPFGLSFHRLLEVGDRESGFHRRNDLAVDRGPFYQRWLADFHPHATPGFTEVLDGNRLHHPLFSWMIPFRLKRPRPGARLVGGG